MKPERILKDSMRLAVKNILKPIIVDRKILDKIEYVCKCGSNRAGARLLLSCLLAKIDNPKFNILKPYTEIGDKDSFSGRTYDEQYITHFINEYGLPCNSTTAFLTPALRNRDQALNKKIDMVGRPREVYIYTIDVLDAVQRNVVNSEDVLIEVIRQLIIFKNEKGDRMKKLLESLGRSKGSLPLSSEAIITLIGQHLASKNSSRLPVLIVAAAYQSASLKLGKIPLPLNSHNAADLQTKSIGDVEICFTGRKNIVTTYEMKMKEVTNDDVDAALSKIIRVKPRIHNYIFITTEKIDRKVVEYANSFYEKTGGTEIAILDCIGFLRHFLHLFNEVRMDFLNRYQELVLKESDSAVSQPLKEAFLAMRQVSESDE
ncbi:MAG: restriction endonuclease, SacI family [Candidatus Micrarchaeota archaeon]|nr:restriction endonuclease, SacI family [Candidatus Micrarchaeota archaeon]